jgi:hypothetical protein
MITHRLLPGNKNGKIALSFYGRYRGSEIHDHPSSALRAECPILSQGGDEDSSYLRELDNKWIPSRVRRNFG